MTDTGNNDHPDQGRISDAEWANRRLCPDGNCIGVIGADGRCKECGRPGGDDLPLPADSGTGSSVAGSDGTENVQTDVSPDAGPEDSDADHWRNRRLGPEGNCIGVIGADGRCKECGRPAESS